MARVLAYTSPATGHVLPALGIILELHRRGHEVHVRTRPSELAHLRALGLSAEPVDPRIADLAFDDWKGRNWLDALNRLQRVAVQRAALEVPDLQRAIGDTAPDCLLVDVASEGAGFAAEASGIPWVQFCPHPPVFGSRDTSPYGPGLRPGHGPITRARDGYIPRVQKRLTDPTLLPQNALRAHLGLAPLDRIEEIFLRATRCILLTAEPYEYPRTDWPANVRLTGPVSWEPPGEPPGWLRDETRPIVLVTASTERQADERLIGTALEALADEDVAVVATTGAHDPRDFTPTANARVERFVPHAPMLERAACVVAHGGQGITQKSLGAGVPVCVVPFCRDQFEVARRVVTAGAGTRLHHKRLNARRLQRAVREAMSRRAGAQRIARVFAETGGAAGAADEVEAVAPRLGATRSPA